MKYTILFIAAVIFIFAACKKRPTQTSCYACNQYDSLIRGGGYKSYPNGITDTMCQMNEGLIAFYMKSHVRFDTFYPSTDSVTTGYTYFRCDRLD